MHAALRAGELFIPAFGTYFTIMFSSPFHAPLAAVVAYAIAVSAIPAVSATPGLAVKTSTPNVIVNGLKNLEVTATIANTGGEALKLLNDPSGILDPFPENSFAITDPSGSRLFGGARVGHVSGHMIIPRANALSLRF